MVRFVSARKSTPQSSRTVEQGRQARRQGSGTFFAPGVRYFYLPSRGTYTYSASGGSVEGGQEITREQYETSTPPSQTAGTAEGRVAPQQVEVIEPPRTDTVQQRVTAAKVTPSSPIAGTLFERYRTDPYDLQRQRGQSTQPYLPTPPKPDELNIRLGKASGGRISPRMVEDVNVLPAGTVYRGIKERELYMGAAGRLTPQERAGISYAPTMTEFTQAEKRRIVTAAEQSAKRRQAESLIGESNLMSERLAAAGVTPERAASAERIRGAIEEEYGTLPPGAVRTFETPEEAASYNALVGIYNREIDPFTSNIQLIESAGLVGGAARKKAEEYNISAVTAFGSLGRRETAEAKYYSEKAAGVSPLLAGQLQSYQESFTMKTAPMTGLLWGSDFMAKRSELEKEQAVSQRLAAESASPFFGTSPPKGTGKVGAAIGGLSAGVERIELGLSTGKVGIGLSDVTTKLFERPTMGRRQGVIGRTLFDFQTGAYEQLAYRPGAAAAWFGVAMATGGVTKIGGLGLQSLSLSTSPVAQGTAKFGFGAAKVVGVGLAGLYIGGVAAESVVTGKPGRVLGREAVMLPVFIGGAKLGGRIAEAGVRAFTPSTLTGTSVIGREPDVIREVSAPTSKEQLVPSRKWSVSAPMGEGRSIVKEPWAKIYGREYTRTYVSQGQAFGGVFGEQRTPFEVGQFSYFEQGGKGGGVLSMKGGKYTVFNINQDVVSARYYTAGGDLFGQKAFKIKAPPSDILSRGRRALFVPYSTEATVSYTKPSVLPKLFAIEPGTAGGGFYQAEQRGVVANFFDRFSGGRRYTLEFAGQYYGYSEKVASAGVQFRTVQPEGGIARTTYLPGSIEFVTGSKVRPVPSAVVFGNVPVTTESGGTILSYGRTSIRSPMVYSIENVGGVSGSAPISYRRGGFSLIDWAKGSRTARALGILGVGVGTAKLTGQPSIFMAALPASEYLLLSKPPVSKVGMAQNIVPAFTYQQARGGLISESLSQGFAPQTMFAPVSLMRVSAPSQETARSRLETPSALSLVSPQRVSSFERLQNANLRALIPAEKVVGLTQQQTALQRMNVGQLEQVQQTPLEPVGTGFGYTGWVPPPPTPFIFPFGFGGVPLLDRGGGGLPGRRPRERRKYTPDLSSILFGVRRRGQRTKGLFGGEEPRFIPLVGRRRRPVKRKQGKSRRKRTAYKRRRR